MPADAGVDQCDAGGSQSFAEQHRLVEAAATLYQIEHGEAEDDDKVRSDPRAGAVDYLQREADTILEAAAPAVLALIGAPGNEFVDEVAFRAHDFHAIVTRLLTESGEFGEVLDLLEDLLFGGLGGHETIDGRLNGGWRDQAFGAGVAAGVQNLQADFAAMLVHGVRDYAMFVESTRLSVDRTLARWQAVGIGHEPAGDDQRNATRRTLGVERRHALMSVGNVFQPRVHGAHEHTVA